MTNHVPTVGIDGVQVVGLTLHGDPRGGFVETYREEWFPGRPPMVQANCSYSAAGVVRALHFHLRQADYWFSPAGRLFVGLYDLRRSSPTRGRSAGFEIGDGAPLGVYIPPGVAHGFATVRDGMLTYLVDRYYDPQDEHGVAWDDPALGIEWPQVDAVLSARDQSNPKLADIPDELMP